MNRRNLSRSIAVAVALAALSTLVFAGETQCRSSSQSQVSQEQLASPTAPDAEGPAAR